MDSTTVEDVATNSTAEMEVAEPEDHDGAHLEFDILMLVIAVSGLGFLGNSFSMVVICHYKKMRQKQGTLLVINQCAVDIVASLLTMIYNCVKLRYGRSVSPLSGLAGDLFCRLFIATPHWGMMTSSSYNLLAITAERYLMVVQPLYHKIRVTRRKLYVVIALVWLVGPMFYATFNTATVKLVEPHCVSTWLSADWKAFYGTLCTVVQFFMPAVVMACCYLRMIQSLKKKVHPAELHGNSTWNQAERNLTKTFMIVVIAFVGCWMTNQVYYFLYNLGIEIKTGNGFHQISTMLVTINFCINPFIFIFNYKDFRDGVRCLLRCY